MRTLPDSTSCTEQTNQLHELLSTVPLANGDQSAAFSEVKSLLRPDVQASSQ